MAMGKLIISHFHFFRSFFRHELAAQFNDAAVYLSFFEHFSPHGLRKTQFFAHQAELPENLFKIFVRLSPDAFAAPTRRLARRILR